MEAAVDTGDGLELPVREVHIGDRLHRLSADVLVAAELPGVQPADVPI